MHIENSKPTFEIEDGKRFHIPGAVLHGKCPKCKSDVKIDFSDDYLSYPDTNTPFAFSCYCRECSHEWKVTMQLNVELVLVDEKAAKR